MRARAHASVGSEARADRTRLVQRPSPPSRLSAPWHPTPAQGQRTCPLATALATTLSVLQDCTGDRLRAVGAP
eukprot:6390871-Prymnesium_polylepis.1